MRITSVLVMSHLPAPSQPWFKEGRRWLLEILSHQPRRPLTIWKHWGAVHRLSIPLRVNDKNYSTSWFPSHSRVPFKVSTKHGSLHLQILFPCPPSSLCFRSLHHLLSFSLSLLLFLLLHRFSPLCRYILFSSCPPAPSPHLRKYLRTIPKGITSSSKNV